MRKPMATRSPIDNRPVRMATRNSDRLILNLSALMFIGSVLYYLAVLWWTA